MIFCYSRKPGLGNQPAENTSNNVIQTCFRSQEEDSYPRHSLLRNSENNKCLCCARSHQFTIKPRSQSIIWPQTQSPLLQFQTNLKILEQRLVNSYGKSLFSFNILLQFCLYRYDMIFSQNWSKAFLGATWGPWQYAAWYTFRVKCFGVQYQCMNSFMNYH